MEDQETGTEKQEKKIVALITGTMMKVITNPKEFYKNMPRTGGFIDPLIFIAVMGVVGGVIHAILSILGLISVGGFFLAISYIVIIPIIVAISGFVIAAIMFIIWKIMGSQESYETAYRCVAYASAITPITSILNVIPYIGTVLGLVWMTYLIIVASTEVHKITPRLAQIVFGAICVILSLGTISAEFTSRKIAKKAEMFQEKMDLEDMTPEEAGKAVGEFLKGLQEATEKE